MMSKYHIIYIIFADRVHFVGYIYPPYKELLSTISSELLSCSWERSTTWSFSISSRWELFIGAVDV